MKIPLLALCILSSACVHNRPKAVPGEGGRILPWGAIEVDTFAAPGPEAVDSPTGTHIELEDSIGLSLTPIHVSHLARDEEGLPTYNILALSGGGDRGAFGAGLLCALTDTGRRPDFQVVTGISTGSLQATFAFLGPEYDDTLREYTQVEQRDIYLRRPVIFAAMWHDSVADTSPLEQLLEHYLTEEVIDAVGREHRMGRRLYVASVDLDELALVVWDLGMIAASDNPDRYDRYRMAVRASAAIPAFFPPVYVPVEFEGETYHQMHVDGGALAPVFFQSFMLDLDQALDERDLEDEVHPRLYVIFNSTLREAQAPPPVKAGVLSIAGASVEALLAGASLGNIYRLYILRQIHGFDLHFARIPGNYPLSGLGAEFDPEEMSKLFDVGYYVGSQDEPWRIKEAIKDPAKALEDIDPDRLFSVVDPGLPLDWGRKDLKPGN